MISFTIFKRIFNVLTICNNYSKKVTRHFCKLRLLNLIQLKTLSCHKTFYWYTKKARHHQNKISSCAGMIYFETEQILNLADNIGGLYIPFTVMYKQASYRSWQGLAKMISSNISSLFNFGVQSSHHEFIRNNIPLCVSICPSISSSRFEEYHYIYLVRDIN